MISLLQAVGMEEKIAFYTLMMTEDSHCGYEMTKWIDIEANKMIPRRTNQWSYKDEVSLPGEEEAQFQDSVSEIDLQSLRHLAC